MDYVLVALSAINSLLLIGIAGSLAKMIKYLQNDQNSKQDWAQIIQNRKVQSTQSSTTVPQNWDGVQKFY